MMYNIYNMYEQFSNETLSVKPLRRQNGKIHAGCLSGRDISMLMRFDKFAYDTVSGSQRNPVAFNNNWPNEMGIIKIVMFRNAILNVHRYQKTGIRLYFFEDSVFPSLKCGTSSVTRLFFLHATHMRIALVYFSV